MEGLPKLGRQLADHKARVEGSSDWDHLEESIRLAIEEITGK